MSAHELLIAPDSELAAIAELRDGLAGTRWGAVDVGTKFPDDHTLPPAFVRVVAAGEVSGGVRSGKSLVADTHLLAVDAFAIDEGDARDLAATCSAIIERAARLGSLGGVPCSESSGGVPANMPHPDVPTHYRYTFTASASLRKVVV